ncbi:DUF2591 domain-containing protein [Candidatus Symbiopectobacterium sp. NZEC135]|uniref:DUF2591 domain-containing protein n=1 Tax=Candidatus Symbiopectobacterium sp. NZEC135 TaxID=2820471 RepID=UPI002227B33B|nr:DUF2591 domain-containing protein [Candidatus Symbiopectobacterium sp. NZEC135]MCW2477732.1 DUF2591 family protein [Candidatus Symbiopectobacterium sp. NZEC135]
MKDYNELSDFEINCEVLEVFSPDIKHMCLSGDNTCFYDCGPVGDGWDQIDIPDYCNSPSAAWPIIVGNRINLTTCVDLWVANRSVFQQYNENPLRAAMIVFLMMKEG